MSDVHTAENLNDAPKVDAAVEAEARDYGWAPKENFKGPSDRWRPADEYVEWAKQSGRLPRSEFDKVVKDLPVIKRENDTLKAQLVELKDSLSEFVEFSTKAEERAYNRAKAELEAKVEAAANNADPAAARAAMAELAALKPEAPKPKVESKPAVAVDPVIQDWISKEDWFNRDQTLNVVATALFGEIERAHPGMSRSEQLAETKRRTVEKFPEKFGINPARENAAAVATPRGEAPRRKSGKTYDDLPADAKQACDKFVKTIPGYTRDKYVKDYDWND